MYGSYLNALLSDIVIRFVRLFFSLIRFVCGYSKKVAGGGAIELVATGVIIIGKEIEIFFTYINLFY